MQGSDVTKQVKWRCLHYFRWRKLGRMQGKREGPSHSKQDGGCFSVFRTSRSRSFVFKHTFSLFLLLTDKTRTAVKVIYLLISVQFIVSMHSERRYSLVFTSVSSSRRCWSLDLVRMCLFVMSIFTPLFFVSFFFHLAFPWVFFFPCFGLRLEITVPVGWALNTNN